jgi:hypothetical protein
MLSQDRRRSERLLRWERSAGATLPRIEERSAQLFEVLNVAGDRRQPVDVCGSGKEHIQGSQIQASFSFMGHDDSSDLGDTKVDVDEKAHRSKSRGPS